ncbi:hypothetical protein D3C81_1510260 [compost metagenome]
MVTRRENLRFLALFLVPTALPWEAFYEQSGFVPSKVEPRPAGSVQRSATGATGFLVMAYGQLAVCDFRRVAVPLTQCTAGQQPDMAPHLGNCKSAPIRHRCRSDLADAADQGRLGLQGD